MGGECLLITLKWGRVLQMENWVEARGWGDQLLSRGGGVSKKSDKQKKDTGFKALPPSLHLGGRGFFFLAWGDPQKDPFLRPVPLCGEKRNGCWFWDLDSVSPTPYHLPKLPFREGGRTLPKGRGSNSHF